jgi:1-phosphofructokinase family hexose kinase
MILCVTLNPLVDTSYFVDEIKPVYRTEVKRITHVPGGKGTNVALALKVLGERPRAFTVLGGRAGRHHADLMLEAGLEAAIAWISGETRVSVTVVDRDNVQRGYFAPPPEITAEDVAVIRREFLRALEGVSAVCICGSALGPLTVPLVPEFIAAARSRGLPTLLDTYGEALRLGVQAAPTIVKANRHEVAGLLGRPLESAAERWQALDELRQSGAEWAIMTLGEEGAMFVTAEERWVAQPPPVPVVNPMGSGDAMTAAVMLGRLRGWPPVECFRYGMAVAVANVQSFLPCQFRRDEVEAALGQIRLVPAGPADRKTG